MFCRWVKVGVAFSFSILFSIPGPNNYESLSNPATPQTVYGDLSNSYHVGGSYQVTTVVIYLLLKFGDFPFNISKVAITWSWIYFAGFPQYGPGRRRLSGGCGFTLADFPLMKHVVGDYQLIRNLLWQISCYRVGGDHQMIRKLRWRTFLSYSMREARGVTYPVIRVFDKDLTHYR